jgi:molybdate transport system substrate-binding protein
VVFARNEPVLVVTAAAAAGAPGVRTLADLPAAGRIVLGGPEVPIGRYSVAILDKAAGLYGADFRARVEARVVSRELNVKQVLAKVTLGEADAGIVYRSDVTPAPPGLVVVSVPDSVNLIASYPIAAVAGAPRAELARAFIDLVLSPEGQRALGARGFAPAGARP